MVDTAFLENIIQKVVPDAEVHATDLGGGDHWFCVVVSPSFEGKRSFQRQRPVVQAFSPAFQTGAVHALDVKCLTPDEVETKGMPKPFIPHSEDMPGMHPHKE